MAMPEVYEDGSASSGVGAISIARGALGAGYLTLCIIETANEGALTGVSSGWNLLGSVGVGQTQLHVYWNTDHGNAFTADDPGDHWVGKMVGFLNADLTQPFHWLTTSTVSTAQTAVAIALQATTTSNCLIMALASNEVDTVNFIGSSNISNASVDTASFGGWMQTDAGVGGGYYASFCTKASAGSTGTVDMDNYSTATRQARMAFAITDTQQPALGGGGETPAPETVGHRRMPLLGC